MEHHPVAAAVAAHRRRPRPAAARRGADRDRAAARPAARRPDRGPRAGGRRRLLPRLVRRLRHRAARGVRGRGGRRPPADPLPPARDPGRDPLGVHPDRGLQARRRAPGGDRPAVLRLPGGRLDEHVPAADPALDAWGDYDRDDPFPLFAQVRATGPVHEVRLADGHPAWLVVGYDEARAALERPAAVQGHARRAGPQR